MESPAIDVPRADFSDLKSEGLPQRLQAFREHLAEIPVDVSWALQGLFPTPLTMRPATVQLIHDLSDSIAAGARAVLDAYPTDDRIRRILALEPAEAALVRALYDSNPRAELGLLRPDFIIDTDGLPRVCEVNARFPTNAFLMSSYMNEVVGRCGRAEWRASDAVSQVTDAVVPKTDCVVVKGEERGWDIHFMAEEARSRGLRVQFRAPVAATLAQTLTQMEPGKVQSIFELHQHELAGLPTETLTGLNSFTPCNDLRTVLLIHDKRFLQVLRDRTIMADYVSPAEVDLLQLHVIATFSTHHDSSMVEEARANRSHWILKPLRFGKSVGIVFGSDCTEEKWNRLLQSKTERVLQPMVPSALVPLPGWLSQYSSSGFLNVVGTILQANGEFLGTGGFRASGAKKLDGTEPILMIPAAETTARSREFLW